MLAALVALDAGKLQGAGSSLQPAFPAQSATTAAQWAIPSIVP